MYDDNWRGIAEMIRRTTTARGRAQSGYFSIEGLRLHERAVRAGVFVQQVITLASLFEDPAPRVQNLFQDLNRAGSDIQIVPDAVVREIIGGRDLGPILGLVKIPEQPHLGDIAAKKESNPPIFLAAVDVQDPGNVGAMLRTAHAAGAAAFVAVGLSDPFHPKALRTTMGSLFKLPVLTYESISTFLNELKGCGLEAVGTAVTGGIPLPKAAFSNKGTAILIGSEAWGLADGVQTAVDWLVSIPMMNGVDSYSVNAAAAIVLYEIGRNRLLNGEAPGGQL